MLSLLARGYLIVPLTWHASSTTLQRRERAGVGGALAPRARSLPRGTGTREVRGLPSQVHAPASRSRLCPPPSRAPALSGAAGEVTAGSRCGCGHRSYSPTPAIVRPYLAVLRSSR